MRAKLASLFQMIISLLQQTFVGELTLPYTKQMHLVPFLEDSKDDYIGRNRALEEVLKDGIALVSHDPL